MSLFLDVERTKVVWFVGFPKHSAAIEQLQVPDKHGFWPIGQAFGIVCQRIIDLEVNEILPGYVDVEVVGSDMPT